MERRISGTAGGGPGSFAEVAAGSSVVPTVRFGFRARSGRRVRGWADFGGVAATRPFGCGQLEVEARGGLRARVGCFDCWRSKSEARGALLK